MSSFEEADKEFTFPPDWAQPILEWATPRFEAAFVLLHLFVKVPEECIKFIEPDGNRWLEEGGFEILMSLGPEHITWETVRKSVGRENLAQLLADVDSNAIGIYTGAATDDSVNKLLCYLRNNHYLAPATYCLPPTQKRQILESLKQYGQGNPQWGGRTIEECPFERANMLFGTPYEAAYSVFCSTKEIIDAVVSECGFDGFYAEPDTLFDWKEGASHERGCQKGAMTFHMKMLPEGRSER